MVTFSTNQRKTSMKTTEFTVTHNVPAPPEVLFDVWMDPSDPRGPWVGDGARRLDPTVGGAFYWFDRNFSDLEGRQEWPHYGRFVHLERPKLIAYTWVSEFTAGLESVVTVTFRPIGEGAQTEVTLCHRGLPDNQDGLDHRDAWIRILGEIGAHFISKAVPRK